MLLQNYVVLSLILVFWIQSRVHEVGVLLSIGVSKLNILCQFIFELLLIGFASFIAALSCGIIILNNFINKFVGKYIQEMLQGNIALNTSQININISDIIIIFITVIVIVLLSVFLSSIFIMRLKPKKILTKMS